MGKRKVTQINLLADYIMAEIPGEPSADEGAGDTAIRLLKKYRVSLDIVNRASKLEVEV